MYFKTSIRIEMASVGRYGAEISVQRVGDGKSHPEKTWVLGALTRSTQDRIERILRQASIDIVSGDLQFYVLLSRRSFKVGDCVEARYQYPKASGVIDSFGHDPNVGAIYGANVRLSDGTIRWINVDSLWKVVPAEVQA